MCSTVLGCTHYTSETGGALDIIYVLEDAGQAKETRSVTQKNKRDNYLIYFSYLFNLESAAQLHLSYYNKGEYYFKQYIFMFIKYKWHVQKPGISMIIVIRRDVIIIQDIQTS